MERKSTKEYHERIDVPKRNAITKRTITRRRKANLAIKLFERRKSEEPDTFRFDEN